jgi:di/tricarboxylate transporter
MESSGAANNIAEVLISFAGSSPITLLASLFFLTAAFSAVISNIAAAVLMFPIALASSQALGVNLTPLVVTIMIAASASFATPIGYQTNLMVYGPGDYRFMDFVRIGVPLTAVVGVVVIVLIPIIWPL